MTVLLYAYALSVLISGVWSWQMARYDLRDGIDIKLGLFLGYVIVPLIPGINLFLILPALGDMLDTVVIKGKRK